MTGDDDHGDDYDIPLEHQRAFGSGIKRKRIQFVKATGQSQLDTTSSHPKNGFTGSSVADSYLSLVLPQEAKKPKRGSEATTSVPVVESNVCAVCHLQLGQDAKNDVALEHHGDGNGTDESNAAQSAKQKHETSIAHQVCLTHSHPPSALDRSRMGLTYLSSHGWDPDSRKGLGAAEQGIQFPIKSKAKDDTFGLGLEVPQDLKSKVEAAKKQKKDPPRLTAKQVRQQAEADKKKGEKLRDMFYGSDDLHKYLGK